MKFKPKSGKNRSKETYLEFKRAFFFWPCEHDDVVVDGDFTNIAEKRWAAALHNLINLKKCVTDMDGEMFYEMLWRLTRRVGDKNFLCFEKNREI